MGEEDLKPLRVGVYIPKDLVEKLSLFMKDMGIDSISKIVQEALRLYTAEYSWKTGGEVVGAIGVLYDHEIGYVDEELTNLQHKYIGIVIASMHIHIDQRNCLLIIAVNGCSEKIKELINSIEKIKGVKMVRLILIPRQ